jgi:hypothetical protein
MTCHGYYSACDRLEPLELPLSRPQLAMRMLRVLLHVEFLAAYEGLWLSARAWFKVYIFMRILMSFNLSRLGSRDVNMNHRNFTCSPMSFYSLDSKAGTYARGYPQGYGSFNIQSIYCMLWSEMACMVRVNEFQPNHLHPAYHPHSPSPPDPLLHPLIQN